MATYNGHKNWNYWNVSLWINNDEGLYNFARDHVRNCSGTKQQAARNFVDTLASEGITKTPDGAPYSVSAVRAAMSAM
jgi:hypothetical protein